MNFVLPAIAFSATVGAKKLIHSSITDCINESAKAIINGSKWDKNEIIVDKLILATVKAFMTFRLIQISHHLFFLE